MLGMEEKQFAGRGVRNGSLLERDNPLFILAFQTGLLPSPLSFLSSGIHVTSYPVFFNCTKIHI